MNTKLQNASMIMTGIIIGLIISGGIVCANSIPASTVEHTKSNGTKLTAEAAINEIYSSYYSSSQYTTYGTNQYNSGYSKGVTDADGRANGNSVNYQTGYNNGYSAGVSAADGRANAGSVNYQSGYNAGVAAADGRAAPGTVNYNSGYNAGVAAADGRALAGTVNYNTGYNNGRAQGQADKYPWNFRVSVTFSNSHFWVILYQNDTAVASCDKSGNSSATCNFGYQSSYAAGTSDWRCGYWGGNYVC